MKYSPGTLVTIKSYPELLSKEEPRTKSYYPADAVFEIFTLREDMPGYYCRLPDWQPDARLWITNEDIDTVLYSG